MKYPWAIPWACACLLVGMVGCTRTDYRLRADRDAFSILRQKTHCAPWQLPGNFRVMPHPASRFYDPTPVDDPMLPDPAPKLYSYCLPELPERDPRRFNPEDTDGPEGELPVSEASSALPSAAPTGALRPVPGDAVHLARLPSPDTAETWPLRLVGYAQQTGELPEPETGAAGVANLDRPEFDWQDDADLLFDDQGLMVTAIRPEVWESIPERCLRRMFEFESVRGEYERTFGRDVPETMTDQSPSMALEDIVDQTQINSREYQAQKEILYLTALRLTLERFDYQHKFTPTGNGTDLNYTHFRAGGVTQNVLGIPTTFAIEKMLHTGGDILVRFANDVVLTFNGPQGFTADVSSEILANFSQALIQRDIRFESLTQAERNVIYAARDYARFRKLLFQDLANSYYSLILTYRGIEIASQDYFSNLRGFNQGEAEYQAGRLPRFQVDQFEQNALRSRSDLISSCNALERALDNLKFQIGLPPEIPINIDLTELELLTLRDEATVSVELVLRARRSLAAERAATDPDQIVLLNGAIDLTRRTANLLQIRRRLRQSNVQAASLERLAAALSVQESRLLTQQNQAVLAQERASVPPAPPLRLYQRTMDVVESELRLIRRQLQLTRLSKSPDEAELSRIEQALLELVDRTLSLESQLEQASAGARSTGDDRDVAELQQRLDVINRLVPASADLLDDVRALRQQSDALLPDTPTTPDHLRQRTITLTDEALAATGAIADQGDEGLVPVEIDVDQAMLTALVQRFEVMNQRGELADVWRQIKLAGDDLRSVLNLNVSQSIRTPADSNRPFDFSFDDSTTNIGLQFDAPLNRRAQRNQYRAALINYNAALRNLMRLEDSIKLDVRDDLRQLQLDREQYRIAVASAALAYERVVSTRLQLRQGVQNVAARDFLEAQQAYTASLNAVASQHTGFITDRIQLFLDLELLQVDETGFWPQLYDEQYQPLPNVAPPPCAGLPYGSLPTFLWYSPDVLRMLCIPWGTPEIGSCE